MVEIETFKVKHVDINSNEVNVSRKDILNQVDMGLVNEVRELIRNEYEKEQDKCSRSHFEEIMDESSPITCWRYLIHCDKSTEDTVSLMKTALIWRKANKIDESIHKFENETPKEIYHLSPFTFSGFDNSNNQVLYVIAKNYRRPDSILKDIVTKFVVQTLIKWDHDNRYNLNQMCLVFDTTDTGYRNIDLDLMTQMVAMRDFIPTRFNRIFVIGTPFLVRPLVKLVISWLPEKFRKIVRCGTYEQLIAPNISIENLPQEVGGRSDRATRLAPINSPWMNDSPIYATNEALRKSFEASFGFNIPTEVRDKLKVLQEEFEDNKITKKIEI